jgi:tetratricopeptide (TPR) repeat protein
MGNILYSLADKYHETGYYAEALRATQKCVDLRPNDIRSTYALATSYNILSRAAWTKIENEIAEVLKELIKDIEIADRR